MSVSRRWRHRVEYGLVMVMRGLLRVSPMSLVRAIGTALGLAFWALDAGHRGDGDAPAPVDRRARGAYGLR